MQYRQLGRSGLKVSPICLGTMMFGGPTDEATSSRIVAKAREAGINFIDSADAYNGGKSEEVVGRAISNNRSNWVLATKLANPIGDDPNHGGLSRRWVLQAADESLKRLGTDYIDVYYLHKEDHATPLEETVRAMGDLIRAGKVRYFGVSNYRAWRVAEICNICDRLGIDRPVASQPYYNAMNRMPEVEHFPACAYYGLGIVPYSPLARGVLTGKCAPDSGAARGHPCGAQRQAHDADRMAAGIPAARAGDQAPRREPRHHRRAVRGVLGAELVVRQRRDRRPTHRGAVGRLHPRARLSFHRRGRSADRPPCRVAAIPRRRASTIRPIRSRDGGRGPVSTASPAEAARIASAAVIDERCILLPLAGEGLLRMPMRGQTPLLGYAEVTFRSLPNCARERGGCTIGT